MRVHIYIYIYPSAKCVRAGLRAYRQGGACVLGTVMHYDLRSCALAAVTTHRGCCCCLGSSAVVRTPRARARARSRKCIRVRAGRAPSRCAASARHCGKLSVNSSFAGRHDREGGDSGGGGREKEATPLPVRV